MKILYITPGCFDKGGISRYCRYQITALRTIFPASDLHFMSLLGQEMDSIEEDFHVDYSGQQNSKIEQLKFALWFCWKVLSWRPEVIHCAHVNFSGMAVVLARLIKAKTVLNVYGLELWSGLSKDASYGLKRVNQIISDCHSTKQYLLDNDLRKSADLEVIWDCVDLVKFKPYEGDLGKIKAKYGISNGDKKIVLTLGRIAKEAKHKGYHRLIEVFKTVNQDEYYLVFAGKGNMVEELKAIVEEYTLTSNVCFTGMIDEADMAALYTLPDVFSLVSEVGVGMGEGIPLTPLEAMACGTPIVVGNQDGSSEAVVENKNGVVIDPFDPDRHKEAIERLTNKSSKDTFKEGAKQVAKSHFSYDRFLEEHRIFYKTKI
jgi:phosphatidylinositol alpha-1,6-mannosyltransferase